MGIFDFFKGKKETPPKSTDKSQLELVEVTEGLQLPRALVPHWPEIAKSRMSTISINATPSEDLALEQSKFGHYPCMPADFQYPKDAEGRYMFPLAQVNFKEVPALEGYPASGYLQIYISAYDEVYGANFENRDEQNNFKVLFFEEAEVANYKADFSFLDEVLNAEMVPVYKPHALSFTKKDEYIGIRDEKVNAAPALYEITKRYPDIQNDLDEIIFEIFQSNGHKIGGYGYFTQTDPRGWIEGVKDYILLLQIDSDDKEIMWGDVGVANFFIHPDDLAKKDFSKVFYTWDCY
jgi:uncharacterized protein YwqG